MTTDDECWAALDRVNAAIAGDDAHEQVAAIDSAMATWVSAGHVTVDDIRMAMLRPAPGMYARSHLEEAMSLLIELDPELAGEHVDIALTKMDGRDGLNDAGWGALVLSAYVTARDDLGLGQIMTPEFRESLVRSSRNIETRTDLAALLLHRHAHAAWTPDSADAMESWSACRGAKIEAGKILALLGERVDDDNAWYLKRQMTGGGE